MIHFFMGRTDINASKPCVNLPNAVHCFKNGMLLNTLINMSGSILMIKAKIC